MNGSVVTVARIGCRGLFVVQFTKTIGMFATSVCVQKTPRLTKKFGGDWTHAEQFNYIASQLETRRILMTITNIRQYNESRIWRQRLEELRQKCIRLHIHRMDSTFEKFLYLCLREGQIKTWHMTNICIWPPQSFEVHLEINHGRYEFHIGTKIENQKSIG